MAGISELEAEILQVKAKILQVEAKLEPLSVDHPAYVTTCANLVELRRKEIILLQAQAEAVQPAAATKARRARIKDMVAGLERDKKQGQAIPQDLIQLLNEDKDVTRETNLYMAVATALPRKEVLGARSSSSNKATGAISPTEVYLSVLEPSAVAAELWPLWDTYVNVPADTNDGLMDGEIFINAKMAELMRFYVYHSLKAVGNDGCVYSQNIVQNSKGGIVDLKCLDSQHRFIVAHEGKTQQVLSSVLNGNLNIMSLLEEYYAGPAAVASEVLPAICGYCHWDGTSHGIVSSYATTTYLRFLEIKGSGMGKAPEFKAFLSQTVLDRSTGFAGDISATMLIVYAVICSIKKGQLTVEPDKHALKDGLVYPWQAPGASQSFSRGPKPLNLKAGGAVTLKTKTQGMTSKTQQHCMYGDVTLELGGVTLLVLNQAVGRGLNGAVHAGRLEGRDVVVKSAKVDGDARKLQELSHECTVYDSVQFLQGVVVPTARLITRTLTAQYLVLDRVRGRHPQALHVTASSDLCMQALEALGRLHDAGWLHGDLRSPNILVEEDTGKVILIDLGRAQPKGLATSEEWRARTLYEEEVMLQLLGAPDWVHFTMPIDLDAATGKADGIEATVGSDAGSGSSAGSTAVGHAGFEAADSELVAGRGCRSTRRSAVPPL